MTQPVDHKYFYTGWIGVFTTSTIVTLSLGILAYLGHQYSHPPLNWLSQRISLRGCWGLLGASAISGTLLVSSGILKNIRECRQADKIRQACEKQKKMREKLSYLENQAVHYFPKDTEGAKQRIEELKEFQEEYFKIINEDISSKENHLQSDQETEEVSNASPSSILEKSPQHKPLSESEDFFGSLNAIRLMQVNAEIHAVEIVPKIHECLNSFFKLEPFLFDTFVKNPDLAEKHLVEIKENKVFLKKGAHWHRVYQLIDLLKSNPSNFTWPRYLSEIKRLISKLEEIASKNAIENHSYEVWQASSYQDFQETSALPIKNSKLLYNPKSILSQKSLPRLDILGRRVQFPENKEYFLTKRTKNEILDVGIDPVEMFKANKPLPSLTSPNA